MVGKTWIWMATVSKTKSLASIMYVILVAALQRDFFVHAQEILGHVEKWCMKKIYNQIAATSHMGAFFYRSGELILRLRKFLMSTNFVKHLDQCLTWEQFFDVKYSLLFITQSPFFGYKFKFRLIRNLQQLKSAIWVWFMDPNIVFMFFGC